MQPVCFLIGVVVDVAMGRRCLGDVLQGGLLDPDSYMRLVRLRAILQAHAPLHAVARDASGTGTVLAWSHLLDSLLLLLAFPLTFWMDQDTALHWAGVASGPLGVGLLCAAIAWAVGPLTDPGWRWTAAFSASAAAPVAGYGLPGVVHHHVLVALACVMVAGFAGRALRDGARSGWHAGLWAAFGLWLSPETMPFILLAFGALGLAWLDGGSRDASRALRAGGSALLLLVLAIVAVDPPQGGLLAAEIDRISFVYVVMALTGAAIGWLLCAIDRLAWRPASRARLGGAVMLLLLGAWLACFPAVLRGPAGLPDPANTQAMLSSIAEMQPVTTFRYAMLVSASGALGAAVVLGIALRERTLLWAYAAAGAVAIVGLGIVHQRFGTYGAVLGAAALPVAIRGRMRRVAGCRPLIQSCHRLAVLALFLLLPLTGGLAPEPASAANPRPECSIRAAAGLLAPYAGRVVLADVNDTPELLYRTGVLTVGSLYHRNAAAFMRLMAAWRSPGAGAEPDTVRATGATAILICPGSGFRARAAGGLGGATLADRLDQGDPPRWLARVGQEPSGYVLYRVVAQEGPWN